MITSAILANQAIAHARALLVLDVAKHVLLHEDAEGITVADAAHTLGLARPSDYIWRDHHPRYAAMQALTYAEALVAEWERRYGSKP